MLRLGFLLIFVASAAAQDCTQVVPVVVVDKETGALIAPLSAEMIVATMGENHLPISGPMRIPAGRIIVLIDESSSMAGGGYAEAGAIVVVKHTLSDLIGNLPPGVSIQYGLFNTKWAFSETFLSDSGQLRKSIDEVTARLGKVPFGHTAIYDSLDEAVKHFGTPRLGDSILLVTDGSDNSSKLAVKKLAEDFRAANARLLTIIVYEPSIISLDLQARRGSIQSLVKQTGGSSLSISIESPWWADKEHRLSKTEMVFWNEPRDVATIHRFWNDQVLGSDVIQVKIPNSVTKETKWKLSLNREADPRLKHATIIYPDRLSPCPVAAAATQ